MSPLKELGYGLLFPDTLLALSIGAAIGIAWAWWDEKKKKEKKA